MASEASRTADSYIGSLISLTTKFEIRYEGILQNINTDESSIGLINVKSYGTEGRKKDGQQIPPNDKVYEYILFRGSDIKDISVKHVPVQSTQPIYNDPAIIQSHYSHSPPVSTSLPSACGGPVSNPSSQAAQVAVPPRSTFEGGLPLYQPGRIWGSSPSLNTDGTGSGLSMPMYWQGFYGPSHVPQQSLYQPPLGMPQPTYPAISAPPIHSGSSNLPGSNTSLLPPFSIGSANLTSTTTTSTSTSTTQSASVPSQSNTLASTALLSGSLPLASQMTSFVPKTAPPILPLSYQPIVENTDTKTPPLVTPSQLLQPALAPLSLSSDPLAMKDPTQVVSASQSTTQEAPILPLPSQRNQEFHRPFHGHQNHINRGRGRGWGNSISSSATRFTEDFDFIAMNEKFNKDEVWGDLGSKPNNNNRKITDEDDILASSLEKCIYKKDEFFDSISCQSNYNGQRNNNGEIFGDFPRHRGGRWRGSYYGRGYYGNVGRGRQGYY